MLPYNATAMAEQIPLLEQYERIKAGHRDEILFFRLGDFYEMFYRDAVEASALLNLTLTHRQEAPMCGIPHHAARGYIARLLKAGKKIAICEQLAAPGRGKGIMERGVVEVITPGSAVDEEFLESGSNNYLVALGLFNQIVSLAWVDASTGEFRACSFPAADMDRLGRELYRLAPRELLVRDSSLENSYIADLLTSQGRLVVNRYPDWSFSVEQGRSVLLDHFGTRTLKGFGFDDDDPALASAGAIMDYLANSSKLRPDHIRSIGGVDDGEHVAIDEASQKNLEIDRNLRDGGRAYTLLEVLDYTKTAMGTRALRRRLLRPLRSPEAIRERLDAVEELYRDQRHLERIRSGLEGCLDLERLAARLSMDKAHARDLLSIRNTLAAALALDSSGSKAGIPALTMLREQSVLDEIQGLVDTLSKALPDEPSVLINEGNIIRDGWNAELDDLRVLRRDARAVLEAYLEEEREATGLSGLRVKYNKIIGYYLELSKNAAANAPSHFIRRQSLSNGERYTTDRLADIESRINGAAERIVDLEKELFLSLRADMKEKTSLLLQLGGAIAELDCSASLAWAATVRAYVRPVVDSSLGLAIHDGRHPVVEAHLRSGEFVPNDVSLDGKGVSFALITGPNMAGKSTYLRQTALITIMAQAGSFVPASEATIGVVDRVFCRVGAQDNLARGESTFLLEMHETASILNNAGSHSLVIMDEVGRGTSTLDGLSIAWAVSEYILDAIGCRSLFATHFHELTSMRHDRLTDLSMAVEERAGEVVFLKRVVQGPAKGSYGIHVARLAGIPSAVVERARLIKDSLEAGEQAMPDNLARVPPPKARQDAGQLFSSEDIVLDELRSMKLDAMTPLEAMNRLWAMQSAIVERKRR
jgi:DNA mismatch repair protein MutS